MVFSVPFFEQKLADRFEVGDDCISYFLGPRMVFSAFRDTDPMRVSSEVLQRWRDAENSSAPASALAGGAPDATSPARGGDSSSSLSAVPLVVERPVALSALDDPDLAPMEEDSDVGGMDPWEEPPDVDLAAGFADGGLALEADAEAEAGVAHGGAPRALLPEAGDRDVGGVRKSARLAAARDAGRGASALAGGTPDVPAPVRAAVMSALDDADGDLISEDSDVGLLDPWDEPPDGAPPSASGGGPSCEPSAEACVAIDGRGSGLLMFCFARASLRGLVFQKLGIVNLDASGRARAWRPRGMLDVLLGMLSAILLRCLLVVELAMPSQIGRSSRRAS